MKYCGNHILVIDRGQQELETKQTIQIGRIRKGFLGFLRDWKTKIMTGKPKRRIRNQTKMRLTITMTISSTIGIETDSFVTLSSVGTRIVSSGIPSTLGTPLKGPAFNVLLK